MRWGRGFFRAWIVLSVIWIGLSAYYFGPTPYQLPWLWQGPRIGPYELEGPSGKQESFSFDPSESQEQLANDVSQALEHVKADPATSAEPKENLLAIILKEYGKQKQAARAAWLFTIIPPIAVFGLGVCLAWILRGFRAVT